MTIAQLRAELRANNIKENACLIEPPALVEGALCLTRTGEGHWRVILNERGEYLINESFRSEHEACRFFLKKALLDPTYRKDFEPSKLELFASKRIEIIAKYDFGEDD